MGALGWGGMGGLSSFNGNIRGTLPGVMLAGQRCLDAGAHMNVLLDAVNMSWVVLGFSLLSLGRFFIQSWNDFYSTLI